MEYEIICPLYIEMGVNKIKRYYLNLNNYRNRHFIVSNNLKKKFKEIVSPQIKTIPKLKPPIRLEFTYYARSKQVGDLENHCICVDKFLQDALVENGIIEEDNCNIITNVEYIYGGINKEDPMVLAKIIDNQ